MSNGFQSCCQYSLDGRGSGYATGAGGSGTGIKIGAGSLVMQATPGNQSILDRISQALDAAIHGGDSGASAGSGAGSGDYNLASSYQANVIPFPMKNPYQPVGDAKVPASGFTAWPAKRLQPRERLLKSVNTAKDLDNRMPKPEDDFEGLGFLDPGGIYAPGSPGVVGSLPGPSTLQTIIGGIATTLPATIQAIRANPSNIYPGNVYGPYSANAGGMYPGTIQTGAGANIGAQTGAAVGNIGDTLGNIVAQHPYLVLGGVAAAILLFMNPPRRR